jgi:hypothetical protein
MDMSEMLKELLGGSLFSQEGMGVADDVPAIIDGEVPAALSEGEFILPADVVSHLGDGNTEAGAKILQKLIDDIRVVKTGNAEQPEAVAKGLSSLFS